MPVMNGLEFLSAVRTQFGPDKPIVVLCTTETEVGRIVVALEAGAQEYVMKPFDEEILMNKFRQAGLLGADSS
jgi:two-component system chemotaxis response regulator CheY